MASTAEKRKEFFDFVWDHAADEFQMSFDARRELTPEELTYLRTVREVLVANDDAAIAGLHRVLVHQPQHFATLIQIMGLTRNKVLQDLKASAALAKRGIKVPSSFVGIPASAAWIAAGPYLVKRLRAVLGPVDPNAATLAQTFEALNQATWPGYIRQERAKRSGHEAEYRLATLLASLEVPFVPFEKAENPLCRDAQIDGISFDIVVPSIEAPRVVFKATVHTANIGQYGESKDHLVTLPPTPNPV